MQSKFDGLMWGLILIVAGGLFLAYNLGYDINLTPMFWMGACAILSAAWFIRYFFSDHKRWGLAAARLPVRGHRRHHRVVRGRCERIDHGHAVVHRLCYPVRRRLRY